MSELAGSPAAARRARFRVTSASDDRTFALITDEGGCRVAPADEASGDADVEVIVSEVTWMRIADGQLSPLDAFAGGQMRVRGDITAAHDLLVAVHDGSEPR